MTGEKTHLIVTGVARSGTTALAELLNSHPSVCIGIERFKFRFLKENDYDPAFFERERFFDFGAGDTNLLPAKRPAWAPAYEQMSLKWDDATVVGDKVPDLIPFLSGFMERNPDFRYIVILRNLKDVGLSWQARAERTRDSWPRGRG
ncbi:MAG: sulfotransferase, partial [Jannaschia sp.]